MLKTPFKNPFKIVSHWILKEYWERFRANNNTQVRLVRDYARTSHNKTEKIREQGKTIERLDELANKLKEEAFSRRGYIFSADKLKDSERLVVGKHIDHELIKVWKKWFKAKADENADLLIHFPNESESKRVGWSIAVRMYDDFLMQLGLCDKMFNHKESIKEAAKKKEEELNRSPLETSKQALRTEKAKI